MRSISSDVHRTASLISVSARSPFEYLEYARVRVEDGRLVFDRADGGRSVAQTAPIPYMNIATLLLGPGTSITNEAMELLAASGTVVGFSGGSMTPLSHITEPVFSAGASEYRPTEFMQEWVRMWLDETRRLEAASRLLSFRCAAIERFWDQLPSVAQTGADAQAFFRSLAPTSRSADAYFKQGFRGRSATELLGHEGQHVSRLYRYLSSLAGVEFKVDRGDESGINKRLRVGNYIAYGLAASALSTLGVSFAFPLLHGKTRRGALVFDVADIIKDGITTPLAFAARMDEVGDYRRACKEALVQAGAMGYLIEVVKELANTPIRGASGS